MKLYKVTLVMKIILIIKLIRIRQKEINGSPYGKQFQ